MAPMSDWELKASAKGAALSQVAGCCICGRSSLDSLLTLPLLARRVAASFTVAVAGIVCHAVAI